MYFERSSRFSFHSFMAIPSSFIHVSHIFLNEFSPVSGNASETADRETVAVSRLPYFSEFSLLIVLSSHSRAYTPRAGLTPPTHPSNLYDRCFSFSFSKPNFSLRNFFHFLIFSQGWKFAFRLQLFGGARNFQASHWTHEPPSLVFRGGQLWGDFSRPTFTIFTFQPLHFSFRSSLFPSHPIHHFIFSRLSLENVRASRKSLSTRSPRRCRSLSRTRGRLSLALRSPFSERKIFIQ